MKRKSHKRNIEWIIILTVALLGISLLLRFINFFFDNESIIQIANIIGAIPVVLLAVFLIVFLIARPFIKKYIIKEMKKESHQKDSNL